MRRRLVPMRVRKGSDGDLVSQLGCQAIGPLAFNCKNRNILVKGGPGSMSAGTGRSETVEPRADRRRKSL